MYLIGIDFGHGETTASFYSTNSINGTVERLHILDGQTPESCKVESAVCRNEKTGDWQFAKDIRDYALPDFTLHFKAPMNEITPKNKEAFGAFIKLVFEHIVQNQSFLNYNPVTGERNFEIYVACPSGWGKEDASQIQEYKKFVSSIIPVDWVFKAEQRFIDTSVLVIDIGSSTIDFTAYGKDVSKPSTDGRKHGASAVENVIFKYFEKNDSDFNKAKQESEPLCTQSHLNWRNAVTHYIKGQKEDYYTNELSILTLDLSNSLICNVKGRIFDVSVIAKEQLENEILAPYRQTLLQDLNDEKLRLEKEQIGIPKIVVLTGGASRMPWLQKLVKDVFTESQVYRDSEPSYVVSDGVAYYAHALYQLKQNIKNVIADFWAEYDDDKLGEMISKQFNISLQSKQLPKIKAICDKFDKGELKYDAKEFEALASKGFEASSIYNGNRCTAAFVPAMIAHNDRIIHDVNGELSREVNLGMNEQIGEAINIKLKEAFSSALHGFVPDIHISPAINIAWDGKIDSQWDLDKIKELTKVAYRKFFIDGKIYKDRETVEERKIFSGKFYQIQESTTVKIDVLLPNAIESLKASINAELTEENMLQKCIFSIY